MTNSPSLKVKSILGVSHWYKTEFHDVVYYKRATHPNRER